uniref:Transmembrane protein n=1 Tax=Strongyloides stercoralis TaxID=6248 RepID=A0A0K0DS02_STRER
MKSKITSEFATSLLKLNKYVFFSYKKELQQYCILLIINEKISRVVCLNQIRSLFYLLTFIYQNVWVTILNTLSFIFFIIFSILYLFIQF